MSVRNLSAGFLAALSAGPLRPRVFFEGQFSGGTVRFWSGLGNISWNGYTWTGAGNLLNVSNIEEAGEIRAVAFTCGLNGVDSSIAAIALNQCRQGLTGKVWIGLLEPNLVDIDFTKASLTPQIGASVASIGFTRAGATATRVNSSGLIETVAADTPRFDYDPVTLACKGLLIEEERTNLLTRSAEFDHADWAKAQTSVTPNAATAPDGTSAFDKIIEDTTNNLHSVDRTFLPIVSDHVISVYAKAGERSRFELYKNDSGFNQARGFDLSNGTTFANSIGYDDAPAYGMENFGGGVYRCWMRFKVNASVSSAIGILLNNGSAASYLGDGSSGLYLWGGDLQAGSIPTSHIPTASSAVTRNAETAPTAIGGWYNASEGTFVSEFSLPFPAATAVAQEGDVLYVDPSGPQVFLDRGDNTLYIKDQADVSQFGISIISGSDAQRLASFYRSGETYGGSLNGATVQSLPQTLAGTHTTLFLGSKANGPRLNGHLRRFTYYPRRLPNAALQALSVVGTDIAQLGDTRIVADPFLAFSGRCDVPDIVDAGETCTISVRYESRLADLERVRLRRYTSEDQQIDYPGDKGFDYVPSLQDAVINWGRPGAPTRLKPN